MAATGPIEKLLTLVQVSDLLGVSPKTLYRWSSARQHGQKVGPEFVKVGGVIRYRPEAVRAYLERAAS